MYDKHAYVLTRFCVIKMYLAKCFNLVNESRKYFITFPDLETIYSVIFSHHLNKVQGMTSSRIISYMQTGLRLIFYSRRQMLKNKTKTRKPICNMQTVYGKFHQ